MLKYAAYNSTDLCQFLLAVNAIYNYLFVDLQCKITLLRQKSLWFAALTQTARGDW